MGDVMDSTPMHHNKGNAKGTHQRGLILLKNDYLQSDISLNFTNHKAMTRVGSEG